MTATTTHSESPAEQPLDSPAYLTKQQLADTLGVSVRTVDALMSRRKLPYLRLTRKLVRFRREDVDEYLRRCCRVAAVGE
jgi:excisionase family DNA binding protein